MWARFMDYLNIECVCVWNDLIRNIVRIFHAAWKIWHCYLAPSFRDSVWRSGESIVGQRMAKRALSRADNRGRNFAKGSNCCSYRDPKPQSGHREENWNTCFFAWKRDCIWKYDRISEFFIVYTHAIERVYFRGGEREREGNFLACQFPFLFPKWRRVGQAWKWPKTADFLYAAWLVNQPVIEPQKVV